MTTTLLKRTCEMNIHPNLYRFKECAKPASRKFGDIWVCEDCYRELNTHEGASAPEGEE